MFNFRAVLARTQPFLSRNVEKRGDQSRFKCRKMVNYYAIRSTIQAADLSAVRRVGPGMIVDPELDVTILAVHHVPAPVSI